MLLPYAIMRFEKRKSGAIGNLNRHHERGKKRYESNPDIDQGRSHQNYHIIPPAKNYRDAIFERIGEAGGKVRKDSVLFIDTLITASPEFFAAHSEQDERIYFEQAVGFLQQEIGTENIISAVVHKDEANPHMHVCFVPITKDNRLSAKDIIGNRNKLVEWQDKFHEHMSRAFPELERGQPASETKRKHMPVRIYKQAVRLDEEMALIRQTLESVSSLNAQKKKKELLEQLAKWMQRYNSFQDQLRPFKNQIAVVQENERSAREQYDRVSIRLNQSESKQHQLQQQLWEYEDFISSIPDNLRQELLERFQQGQPETSQHFEQ